MENYTSKDSFQYGFRVFLMTEVVLVCSPSTVKTAKGSGNPFVRTLTKGDTENISLRQAIRRND
jgi:hypothetical protein